MKGFKRAERGFTLIEVLIVIAILGVLVATVVPSVLGMSGRGSAQAWATDASSFRAALAGYFVDVHHRGGIDANPVGHYWLTYSGMNNGEVDPSWRPIYGLWESNARCLVST